jgi:glyoxylase-like metal-dependent hydrolase (beta-lactamase superfamily II)
MLSIQIFEFNGFAENTYVVSDETKEAVIIDPGCYSREEQRELVSYVEQNKLSIKYILNTHGHIDHILGNDFTKDKFKAPLLISKLDEATARAVKNYASVYGFDAYREAEPDQLLSEGETIAFGNTEWKVLFLPGHSAGHIGFYDAKEKAIFSGDVLFAHSIGRTDLPGGNFDTLINSIHKKLFTLPDEVVVYPGHGSSTTIGEEKISNPFCSLSLIR